MRVRGMLQQVPSEDRVALQSPVDGQYRAVAANP
jgi:hypothetical protein